MLYTNTHVKFYFCKYLKSLSVSAFDASLILIPKKSSKNKYLILNKYFYLLHAVVGPNCGLLCSRKCNICGPLKTVIKQRMLLSNAVNTLKIFF